MEISTIKLKLKDASLILIFLALLVYINGYERLFLFLLLVFVIIYFTPNDYFNKALSYFTQKKSILKKVRVVEEVEPDQEQEEYQQDEYQQDEQEEQDDNYDTESQANTEITIDDDIENEDIQINKISQNNNND
jgi:hypothetical protein